MAPASYLQVTKQVLVKIFRSGRGDAGKAGIHTCLLGFREVRITNSPQSVHHFNSIATLSDMWHIIFIVESFPVTNKNNCQAPA